MEVHHLEPRHPFEDPLLLVMVQKRPVEWYFRVSSGVAIAVCRLQFTGEVDENTKRKIHPDEEIPVDVADALRNYSGEYAPENVLNPTTTVQTLEMASQDSQ